LAVLHGDPVKENADMFLQVPGDSVLADHKHTSAERCDNVYEQAPCVLFIVFVQPIDAIPETH
jgi:hypothetical protein